MFKNIRNISLAILLGMGSLATVSADNGVDYFEISKNIDIFVSLFKDVNIYYVDKIDPSTLIRKGIDAMLESLDPYTEFYSESETEEFRIETTGRYAGIGSLIGQHGDTVFISQPYEGKPAYEAGLRIDDRILEIDGKSIKGKGTKDVSKLLKGPAGTKVKVTIARLQANGSEKIMTFDILRQEIKLKNVPYYGLAAPKIGYIRLDNFSENAGLEVRNALKELKTKHQIDHVILDLRGNGGGLLNEAVNVSNVFINQGSEIVSTKGKIAENQHVYTTVMNAEDAQIPLIVLINGGSASASEIVTGSIQDYDRGVIIGSKSFGKGLVQSTRPLPYNTQLKVTTAKYYIPSGRCIQAINYAEKNPDGSVKKVPDSLKIAFKTKAGRIVYDGGGIDPDINTKKEFWSNIVYALLSKDLIGNFATQYCAKNPKPASISQFKFTEAQYQEFTTYLKSKKFEYESESEASLKAFKAKAENEKLFNSEVESSYKSMLSKLSDLKNQDIIKFKADVLEILEAEIIRRYFSETGVIEYSFKNDKDMKAAIELFNNKVEYQKILKK